MLQVYGDLKGKVFNSWTVLSKAGNGRWNCKCTCGDKSRVSSGELVKGRSKGCRTCSCALPDGIASFNSVYYTYKTNALRSKRDFLLSKEQAKELFENNCYYCGAEPSLTRKPKNRIKTGYTYNGIDRVVNEIGYTYENCVTCCKICNHMKHILSEYEFITHIGRIYNYRRCNV